MIGLRFLLVLSLLSLLLGCGGDSDDRQTGGLDMEDSISMDDVDGDFEGDYQPSAAELEQWALEDGLADIQSDGDGPLSGFKGNVALMGFVKSNQYVSQATVSFRTDEDSPERMRIVISSTTEMPDRQFEVGRYPIVEPVVYRGGQKPDFDVIATLTVPGEANYDLMKDYETVDGFIEFSNVEDVKEAYEKIGSSIERGQQLITGLFEVTLKHRETSQTVELSGQFKRLAGWERML